MARPRRYAKQLSIKRMQAAGFVARHFDQRVRKTDHKEHFLNLEVKLVDFLKNSPK